MNTGQLTPEQLAGLEDWSCNLDPQNGKNLVPEGGTEMAHLAKRMQSRFPNIMKRKYNKDAYLVSSKFNLCFCLHAVQTSR